MNTSYLFAMYQSETLNNVTQFLHTAIYFLCNARVHIWLIIIIIIIIIIITLFNEGKDIDYWSPSSFHNGPPEIKSTLFKSLIYNRLSTNQIKRWFLVRGENRSTRGENLS